MKTTLAIYLSIIALFSTLFPIGATASDLAYPNRYSNMAESLFDMIDAFATAFQNKKHEYNRLPGYPSYYYPPGGYPAYPDLPPHIQPYYPPHLAQPPHPLEGQWQNNSGEMLIVRQGRFRIYRNRNTYREGYIQLLDGQILALTDAASGVGRPYQYALHEGRLALQDEFGNLLLFIRIGS